MGVVAAPAKEYLFHERTTKLAAHGSLKSAAPCRRYVFGVLMRNLCDKKRYLYRAKNI